MAKRRNGGIKMEKMGTLLHTISLIGNRMTQWQEKMKAFWITITVVNRMEMKINWMEIRRRDMEAKGTEVMTMIKKKVAQKRYQW